MLYLLLHAVWCRRQGTMLNVVPHPTMSSLRHRSGCGDNSGYRHAACLLLVFLCTVVVLYGQISLMRHLPVALSPLEDRRGNLNCTPSPQDVVLTPQVTTPTLRRHTIGLGDLTHPQQSLPTDVDTMLDSLTLVRFIVVNC